MNKNFTKEDIIKKHETNIKSACAGLALAGVLGIIYVVRYFITGNFDFHFSLSFPEMMLKLGASGRLSVGMAYTATAIFLLLYLVVTVAASKKPRLLFLGLSLYFFDFLCLLFFMLVILKCDFESSLYIEVILHIFNILFLSVGVYSQGRLKKMK